MTIVDEVKAAATAMGMAFMYGNENENNLGLDTWKEFPVCVLMPPVVNDTLDTAGRWPSAVPMSVFYLDRIPAATIDYKSGEVEPTIQSMRKKGRQVATWLNANSELRDRTKMITSLTHSPTYGEFDSHLFGVLTQFSFPIDEGTVC